MVTIDKELPYHPSIGLHVLYRDPAGLLTRQEADLGDVFWLL